MNAESVQHTTLANYMANMSIMFTMSDTLPGTYVKHVQKAPNKSILQESLNMSIMFTMSNTLPGTYVDMFKRHPTLSI